MRVHRVNGPHRKAHHHHHRLNTKTLFPASNMCLKDRITRSPRSSSRHHSHAPLGLLIASPDDRSKLHRLSTCSSSSAALHARPYRIRRLLSYRHTRMNQRSMGRVNGGSASTASASGSASSLDPALSPSNSLSPSALELDSDLPRHPSPQHDELVMLKREAFQELASQTQRSDDLFIAKMIYWESLGIEEKAQWLERGQSCSNGLQGSIEDIEHEVDDLVDALECQATCKDYSALLAFEKQGEMERRQRRHAGQQQQDPLNGWEAGYYDAS